MSAEPLEYEAINVAGGKKQNKNAYLSRLFTGRLKLGLLARLFDLLVLGQIVGMRSAHAARGLFFLAQDFAGTTGRLRELSCKLDLAATVHCGYGCQRRLVITPGSVHHPESSSLATLIQLASPLSQSSRK